MAEAVVIPEPGLQEVEIKPPIPKVEKPLGQIEARMAGIAAQGENPDSAFSLLAGEKGEEKPRVSLRTDFSSEGRTKAAQLRDETRVGKNQYGEGLVKKHHEGVDTLSGHEKAQALAYKDLQQKIDQGLVDPSVISTEMCLKLGVTPDIEGVPESFDGISGKVNEEMQVFRENGQLTEEEFATLTKEVTEFTNLYGIAYGKESTEKAYELVRDNARKLVYQHLVDKAVFVGSDHGLRHIINGDIRFAKQMMISLRERGVRVSAKDEVNIHQTIIDHDIGYTVGSAQARYGFEATKDHPLVSARFIEDNKDYYVDKFGEDGFNAIHNSVLNHSYPRLEYQSDGQEGVHEGLIRGVSSTVDSLGVTVETKTPEFFWNKDAMRTLLKIRLAMETMGGKVPTEHMDRYKQELTKVAQSEQNADRRASYENAVNNFFNEFTAENTLGHYTGVVRKVEVEEVPSDEGEEEDHAHDSHGHEGEDKKFRVLVEITPTEVYALLGNMFGDKLATRSFVKAIKDLGLNPSQLESHGRGLRETRANGAERKTFEVSNKTAHVVVGNEFLENQPQDQISDVLDAQKIQTIAEVFHEVEILSMRTEINELLDAVGEKGVGVIPEIRARFESSISSKMNASEIEELNNLLINLSDNSFSGEKDPSGKDITVSQAARTRLKTFRTTKENEFLGIGK